MSTINLFELKGNVAVITGGNGGSGRIIAIAPGWTETDTTASNKESCFMMKLF